MEAEQVAANFRLLRDAALSHPKWQQQRWLKYKASTVASMMKRSQGTLQRVAVMAQAGHQGDYNTTTLMNWKKERWEEFSRGLGLQEGLQEAAGGLWWHTR
jgi:hypothetical protein